MNVTHLPRPTTAAQPRRVQPRPNLTTVDNTLLHRIADDPDAARGANDDTIGTMACELLAHRAMDRLAQKSSRAKRKADAILACFGANFRMTGKGNHLFRSDTIANVIVDELRASGWSDVKDRDVFDVLQHLSKSDAFPVTLKTHDVGRLGPRLFMHGVVAQGAPT